MQTMQRMARPTRLHIPVPIPVPSTSPSIPRPRQTIYVNTSASSPPNTPHPDVFVPTNVNALNKLTFLINKYNEKFPPVGNLERIPKGIECDMYYIAHILRQIIFTFPPNCIIIRYNLRLLCSRTIPYMNQKLIGELVNFATSEPKMCFN
jgi:hypothetical protein